jgi:hypothetical protein
VTTPPGATTSAGSARLYAGYLGLQAVAGVLVWVVVAVSATARSWVELSEAQTQVTDAFFLADMVVVASSALSAVAIWNRWPSALLLTAFTAGGVVYPTVYLLAWESSTDGRGTAPLALMLAVSTLTLWALSGVWRSSRQPSGISSHH